MLIFDAHLDLSMNALDWNRDITRPVAEIRERERGLTDKTDRGRGTVLVSKLFGTLLQSNWRELFSW